MGEMSGPDRMLLASRVFNDLMEQKGVGAPTPRIAEFLAQANALGFTRGRAAGRNERHCRICGCTENSACPGRCAWVGEDLCSTCGDTNAQAAAEVFELVGWS